MLYQLKNADVAVSFSVFFVFFSFSMYTPKSKLKPIMGATNDSEINQSLVICPDHKPRTYIVVERFLYKTCKFNLMHACDQTLNQRTKTLWKQDDTSFLISLTTRRELMSYIHVRDASVCKKKISLYSDVIRFDLELRIQITRVDINFVVSWNTLRFQLGLGNSISSADSPWVKYLAERRLTSVKRFHLYVARVPNREATSFVFAIFKS